jgi:hypothetical protein
MPRKADEHNGAINVFFPQPWLRKLDALAPLLGCRNRAETLRKLVERAHVMQPARFIEAEVAFPVTNEAQEVGV